MLQGTASSAQVGLDGLEKNAGAGNPVVEQGHHGNEGQVEQCESLNSEGNGIEAADGRMKDDQGERDEEKNALYQGQGRWCNLALTACILFSHALLLWGQIAVLWELSFYASLEFDAEFQSPLFEFLGYNTSISIEKGSVEPQLIAGFTYTDSIVDLWHEPHFSTKFSAVFLVVFSAIWPHVKLVLLHWFYYRSVSERTRRKALYWLSAFGKLSLADVCVTCFLFALLNVKFSYSVGPVTGHLKPAAQAVIAAFADSISTNSTGLSNATLTTLKQHFNLSSLVESLVTNGETSLWSPLLAMACSAALKTTCPPEPFDPPPSFFIGPPVLGVVRNCYLKSDTCEKCTCAVNTLLYEKKDDLNGEEIIAPIMARMLALAENLPTLRLDELDVDGELIVGLQVVGTLAFLGFTVAVFVSISASAIVDSIEESQSAKKYGIHSVDDAIERVGKQHSGTLTEPSSLLVRSENSMAVKVFAWLFLFCLAPIVVASIAVPIFEWKIVGTVPTLLSGSGQGYEEPISMLELVGMVSQGNAIDIIFMILFGVSVIGVPILRAVVLSVGAAVPLGPKMQFYWIKCSNIMGAFIGWEPLLICIVLIQIELPPLTKTLISDEECEAIQTMPFFVQLINLLSPVSDACFIMYFDMLPAITVLIFAWIALLVVNARAWTSILRLIEPFGPDHTEGGPPCCCQCGSQCCDSNEGERENLETGHCRNCC